MYQKVSLRTPFLTGPAGKRPAVGASTSIVTALSAWLEHTGERVARHGVRRVVRELGIELGLEVSRQLATRPALRDRVVDLRDDEIEIDAVVRVAVVAVGHPVTFTLTGSATVPVVFSGFITSNQCRCSLQS